MLACTQIYLELEPFLWSKIDFVIGLPQFCVFFRPNLAIPLRNRFPELSPRHPIWMLANKLQFGGFVFAAQKDKRKKIVKLDLRKELN
jgi:hypothetical protein